MYKLIIIGAGNLGREIAAFIDTYHCDNWQLYGFIDDNLNVLKPFNQNYEVIGTIDKYQPKNDEVLCCAISEPSAKMKICAMLDAKGAHFVSLIHSTSIVAKDAVLGRGVILCPYTFVSTNTRIGNFVTINVSTTIGHDVTIGDGCTLSCHCDVTGRVCLGRNVFMGSHATIIPGIKVGDNAIIGAGSAAVRHVPENKTVFGVPAKIIC